MATHRKQRTECRNDYTLKNPNCTWCYFKHSCSGPVVARKDFYSYYNCPDEPDTGDIPKCGTHRECIYCVEYGRKSRF